MFRSRDHNARADEMTRAQRRRKQARAWPAAGEDFHRVSGFLSDGRCSRRADTIRCRDGGVHLRLFHENLSAQPPYAPRLLAAPALHHRRASTEGHTGLMPGPFEGEHMSLNTRISSILRRKIGHERTGRKARAFSRLVSKRRR